jgi:hypothetical protein
MFEYDEGMSSVAHLDHRPGARPAAAGQVSRRLAWLDRGVDRLAFEVADESQTVSGADVQELDRVIRRMEATKLALIAKADRQEVRRRSGAASTSAWVATLTNASGGGASCDVALATALDENLPATKAAFGAGEVSRANAGIVADTMAKLPETLSEPERVKVEQAMVRDAKRLPPGRLRKAGLVAIGAAERSVAEVAQHQEDQLVDQERRAYAASYLSMFDRPDGTTKGEFVVPTGAAHVLRKVVQSMTSPRRNHLNSTAEATLADGQQPAGDLADGSVAAGLFAATAEHRAEQPSRNPDWDALDWRQKRGRALVELLEHLPTDQLTGKVASTVVVSMTVEQVMGAAATAELSGAVETATGRAVAFGPSVGAATCDTGHQHSTSEARRLACNAGLLPVVLGGTSVPLDLGRQERFYSEAQRTALAALYDECAAVGCDRPYAWSELHHEDPWSRGGHTNLDRAIPLCGHHHRLIHDAAVTATIRNGPQGVKTVTFRRDPGGLASDNEPCASIGDGVHDRGSSHAWPDRPRP